MNAAPDKASNARVVQKAPLPWWLSGLFLGLVQVLAVALQKPLGVSTQFVVVNSLALRAIAPQYAAGHGLIQPEKYAALGYEFWLISASNRWPACRSFSAAAGSEPDSA